MAITWNTPPGTLGTFDERTSIEIPLSATSSGAVSYKVISGSLPVGLSINGNRIKGTPVEVRNTTQYKFVIRATSGSAIADRTFALSLLGPDAPVWETPSGFLPLGFNDSYFILDDTFVDFQLEAFDSDVIVGDVLRYYIPNNGGELPPGLTLSAEGKISGFVKSIERLEFNQATGNFDTARYDQLPFDLGERSTTGYDTFTYDNTIFDFSEPVKPPRQISRYYSFTVNVTDGISEASRNFRIYLVDEEFLRADNAIIKSSDNVFRADNHYLRNPLWITPPNLGKRRANNYVTVYLDVYNPITLNQNIVFFLDQENPDGTQSVIPLGLQLDSISGELVGKIPYQPKITVDYKFTIRAVSFTATTFSTQYTSVGSWNPDTIYSVGDVVRWADPALYNDSSIRLGIGESLYICLAPHRNRSPSNVTFWSEGATSTLRTFSLQVFGDIESGIEWITPSNLGTIKPNQTSEFSVEAKSYTYSGTVNYILASGKLPPGLEFLNNGLIVGRVNQIGDQTRPGLTRFYDGGPSSNAFGITFDGGRTTFDKEYVFTVKAKDPSNFSEREKTFKIKVISEDIKEYTNIYFRALQTKENRDKWYDFITDSVVFNTNDLYRVGDPAFGVQSVLQVLLFAGLENTEVINYVQAISRNHFKKQLRFGNVKSAQAKDPITQKVVYEVVYVDVVDELEKNRISISQTVNLPDYIKSKVLVSYDNITVDSNIPFVSDQDKQRVFPNSFKNMRNRLKDVGERDRQFLPLWMRTIQEDSPIEISYTKALVLCYTKPGKARDIITKINAKTTTTTRGSWTNSELYAESDTVEYRGKYYTCIQNNRNQEPGNTNFWVQNFDFKLIDFDIDRYVIDYLNKNVGDKYLAFPQRGE
jgi:hypothetical protein